MGQGAPEPDEAVGGAARAEEAQLGLGWVTCRREKARAKSSFHSLANTLRSPN